MFVDVPSNAVFLWMCQPCALCVYDVSNAMECGSALVVCVCVGVFLCALMIVFVRRYPSVMRSFFLWLCRPSWRVNFYEFMICPLVSGNVVSSCLWICPCCIIVCVCGRHACTIFVDVPKNTVCLLFCGSANHCQPCGLIFVCGYANVFF